MIELLVVIVILGILMAVAVPTFLRQQSKAQDSKTQQYLTTAFKAIRASTPDTGNAYPSSTSMVSWVQQSEPELTAQRGSCTNGVQSAPQDAVLVDPSSTPTSLTLCAKSRSGNIWTLTASNTGVQSLLNGTLIALTETGGVITDSIRAGSTQGDGLASDSSTGVWEATTNLALWSNDMTQTATWVQVSGGSAGWTATHVTGDSPAGSSGSATRFDYTDATNGMAVRQNVAVSSNTTYTYSVWVKLLTATKLRIGVYDVTNSAELVGPNIYTPTPNVWTRLTMTFTTGASTATAGIYVDRAGMADPSFLGSWLIGWAQLEQKAFATPYVPTTSSTASRASAHITAPSSLLKSNQGWVAARVTYGLPSTTTANAWKYLFDWRDDTSHRFSLSLNLNNPRWEFLVASGSQNQTQTGTISYNVGDPVTLIATWSGSTLSLSINGAAFTTASQPMPTLTASTFSIGSDSGGSENVNGNIRWFACGTGTLANADAASINSWGDSDPSLAQFPTAAQATMVWNGIGSTGSLK